MGKRFEALTDEHIGFIERQRLFFVGTAGAGGTINVSPKGTDSLRVLGPDRIVWLNLTGSGNETAAHVIENPRMTIMFCSFEERPLILRLYGRATLVYPRHEEKFKACAELFGPRPGTRQFFEFDLDMAQTSCGFGVPLYEFRGEREALAKWAANKGEDGIRRYWADRNRVSLDGKPTGIVARRQ